jgi:hypothetical protein
VCEQQPTGLRDALAVGHETIGDLLAIGNEFRTHGQRVVHAGFAAPLVVGVRLARERRQNEAKQRQPERSAHVRATTKAALIPSATAMRKRYDSQSAGESGGLS